MPTFSYQAINVDGQEVAGTLEAGGLGAAIDKIRELGLFPDSVKSDSEADALRRFFGMLAGLRFGGKSRQTQIALFTRELADLLAAGVALPLSLSILHDRQKPGRLKNVLRQLARDVEAGAELSDALEKQRRTFGDLSPQIARAGERSGRLIEAFSMLADLNQKRLAQAKARRKAFESPIKILVVGFLVFLYSFGLPAIAILFSGWSFLFYGLGRGISLPLVAFLAEHFLELIGYPILTFLAAKALLKLGPIRAIKDAALLRLPIIGKLSRATASSQLARPLGIFLDLGVSFPDALRGARAAVGNLSAAKAADRIALSIDGGQNKSDSLEKGRLFHPAVVKMLVMAGDEDDPKKALQKTADACDDRLKCLVNTVSTRLMAALLLLFTCLVIWQFATAFTSPGCIVFGALV